MIWPNILFDTSQYNGPTAVVETNLLGDDNNDNGEKKKMKMQNLNEMVKNNLEEPFA